jgi:hypothetical protein
VNRVSQVITTIFLFLLWISPFASAVCIALMWRCISLIDVEVQHRWRKAVLRAAQVLIAVAAILTWYYPLNHGDFG